MKKNEIINFYQDKENTLPDYQRAVCGIVRISNHCYKLINHKGTIIWDSNSQKSITSALSQKSKDYYNNNKYLSDAKNLAYWNQRKNMIQSGIIGMSPHVVGEV